MKKIVRLLLIVALFALSFQVHADVELQGENESHMKALPKIFEKKFETYLGLYDQECVYKGKRVMRLKGKGDLWFISVPCGGSGGNPMWIALVSGQRVTTLLDTGAAGSITIKENRHGDFPDLEVGEGSASFGSSALLYRFNGKTYEPFSSYRDAYIPQQLEQTRLPPEIRDFLLKKTQTNSCLQQLLKSASDVEGRPVDTKASTDDIAFAFSTECLESGALPVWVIAAKPMPHFLLNTMTVKLERTSPIMRLGPGSGHGLDDLCVFNDDDTPTERCWRYDGTIYLPRTP
jgi:hypothetical protein